MLRAFITTTGRSGTRSLSGFLDMLLQNAGAGSARDHTDVFTLIRVGLDRLTRPDYDPGPIVGMMQRWQHTMEVNPGPCFVLPEVLEAFGPDLPVIHLVRERDDFIESCVRNIEISPGRWGNFLAAAGPTPEVERPTAVHFGEMDEGEWQALSLRDRVAWLYDAHLRETERMLPSFRRHLRVRTEDLNRRSEQQRIAAFLDLPWSPVWMPWTGWAKAVALEGVDQAKAEHLQLTLQKFDWNRALHDVHYPFMHFAQVEVAWFLREPQDAQRRANLMMIRDLINQALEMKPEGGREPGGGA